MYLTVNCSRNSEMVLKLVGQVFDQNSQNVVWINNSRTAWPIQALLKFDVILEFSGQFTIRCINYYLFKDINKNIRAIRNVN